MGSKGDRCLPSARFGTIRPQVAGGLNVLEFAAFDFLLSAVADVNKDRRSKNHLGATLQVPSSSLSVSPSTTAEWRKGETSIKICHLYSACPPRVVPPAPHRVR